MTRYAPLPTIVAKVERWLNEPDTEQSVSAQIARKVVESTEPFNIQLFAAELGASGSLAHLTISDMRRAGHIIHSGHGQVEYAGMGEPIPDEVPEYKPPKRVSTPFSEDTAANRAVRWLSDPEGETSVSAVVARRLASGEKIRASQIRTEYSRDGSLVSFVVRCLRAAGHTLTPTPQGWVLKGAPIIEAQLSLPTTNGHVQLEPMVMPPSYTKRTPTPEPAPEPMGHPMVGGHLQVRAVFLNDDGLEIMAIDGNGHSWQLRILGQA